ncbi:MAG: hypothetical protein ABR559_09325 [Gemmatimonadota bacterium]
MESKSTSSPRSRRRAGAGRPRSVVALAAALLVTSLFVDVGVARAEYPEGWVDPDLERLGSCIGMCGSAFLLKGALAKYGFGASCLGCLYGLAKEFNDWAGSVDYNCVTGVLGMPCGDDRVREGS